MEEVGEWVSPGSGWQVRGMKAVVGGSSMDQGCWHTRATHQILVDREGWGDCGRQGGVGEQGLSSSRHLSSQSLGTAPDPV